MGNVPVRVGTTVDDSWGIMLMILTLYITQTVRDGHKGHTVTLSVEEDNDRSRGVPFCDVCVHVFVEEAGTACRGAG